ncbi:enoyl-CoA hydratase/isomerase family protein [Numidum massiliense]|uniref:enoyl-CoA hydratase/isomerase family protein n=1 Tax=Numidum massiliense TaxID=1522315 RepID=UPI0006D53DBA|nr:enoyl-CoA hydratase-related protein [Numidum massiliense]
MEKNVLYEVTAGVAYLTLNRPHVLNAFNEQMHNDLYEAFERAGSDRQVRAIVLRGNGKGFSAGADLSMIDKDQLATFDHGEHLRHTYNRVLLRMAEIEQPIIAAMHGATVGAGLSLALACDFRLAAESSVFSLAFVNIGLVPDAGSSYFLPRIVGLSKALELAVTGRKIGSDEAEQIGLVNRVVADEALAGEVEAFAKKLAHMPTQAIGLMKRTMYASFENDLHTVLENEVRTQSLAGKTADHLEGVQAFYEKRRPQFTGQ